MARSVDFSPHEFANSPSTKYTVRSSEYPELCTLNVAQHDLHRTCTCYQARRYR